MNKRVKMIITLCGYAAVICAGILLIPRFFQRASKQEPVGEVVYGSVRLSAPLYPSAPGDDVTDNKMASLDFSNMSQGYISVRYKGGDSDGPVVKVACGDTEYTYFIGGEETLPLTCGDGKYTVKVYKRQQGGKYKAVLTKTLSVELDNQLLPYLYPSQIVNYSASSLAVQFSAEMCGGLGSDLDKLKAVYSYIIENVVYDYPKAANIVSGYIPTVDSTYMTNSGICFDYSVLMAAMLRTQLVPVKLVMGYLNGTSVYHAWNEVYLEESGWVTVNIYIDMETFSMLDSTLAASQEDEVIAKKLGAPDFYLPVFKY